MAKVIRKLIINGEEYNIPSGSGGGGADTVTVNALIDAKLGSFDSLFKFLSSIGCEKYVNNFRRNGYYNSELLFSQMLTRESITKQMIKNH